MTAITQECYELYEQVLRAAPHKTPSHGRAKVGRPARSYIQQLRADTGCSPEDFPGAMDDGDGWQVRVREIRAGGSI